MTVRPFVLDRYTSLYRATARSPFTMGPVGLGRGSIVIDIQHTPECETNAPLQELHQSGWRGIVLLAHPDCPVTWTEHGLKNFRAHLTPAMADVVKNFSTRSCSSSLMPA